MRVANWGSITVATCLVLTAAPAAATSFCAHNTADIQAALTTAQTNGEDDQIKITTGNIGASALTFSSTEGHSIELYGGHTGLTCDGQVSDPTTVLDGQNTVRILYLHNPGGIVAIGNMTFLGGKAPVGTSGGGIFVDGAAFVFLFRDTFFGNRTTGTGGAVAMTAGAVEFVDNLLVGNHGGQVGGVFFNLTSTGSIIANNTIVANISDDLTAPAGMSAVNTGTYGLFNNIIWNNAAPGGSDFGIFSTNTRTTNDIGIVKPGSTAGTVSGELSIDPHFAPCTGFLCINFELDSASPLVNAGSDVPAPFGVGTDITGKPRTLGSQVDIGAYENDDLIFRYGFQ